MKIIVGEFWELNFQIMDKNDKCFLKIFKSNNRKVAKGGYYSFVLGQTLDIIDLR